jgi:DNA polymerase I-like protein with 3'-5' exonuclease and polymerase domains
MIQTFKDGRDIYAGIAEKAFGVPYEQCREFGPNGEYQPEGKKRRSNIKSVLLGVLYGRTIQTIADQLYGDDPDLTDEQKYKKGEQVYNAVLFACPGLRNLMNYSQRFAQRYGYVETVLGRRRHIPDMMLPKFEFFPTKNYVNPDVDPMDVKTLQNAEGIPARIQESLLKELTSYRYYGQVYNRIRTLTDEGIRVVNHSSKIADAERQCVNSRVQGSAADMTKMAMLLIESNQRWKEIGAQVILPVHDELLAEAPLEYAKEAGQLLASLMEQSASFLQFPIKCDVTTTFRWYGIELESFEGWKKPEKFSENLSEDEVKWVQGCLFEIGYDLPVIKVDGKTPGGDAANGVNGQVTPEYTAAIIDYLGRYHITEDEFVNHIWNKVSLYQ